jgi:hypothetical protein
MDALASPLAPLKSQILTRGTYPPRSYAYFDSLTRLAVVAGRRPASVPGFDPWALFLYELRPHLGSRRVDVQLVNGSCQEVLGMLTEACDEVSMPPSVGE